ncbi:serpin family protein [Candidatus Solirubrobacter pratensis]|uniref:serpin family protein n=1 Tax=Candidatus Solirubrobacter pratensis TaxID=1298857 RepID=UPI000406FE1A|nr:serpin family protein [Candidatus Solirubrobacter pratensis]
MDAFALLDRLDGRGDTVLSPYGVRRALDVVRRGARGETRAALEEVLGPGEVPEVAAPGLALAQAAWLADGYTPGPALTLDTGPLDAERVNAWARERTHGMIPSVVDGFDPDEKLALTDAIYLDAKWRLPFHRIGRRPFDGAGEVEMMAVEGVFEHADGAIRLPYGDGELRFVAVLDPADPPPMATHAAAPPAATHAASPPVASPPAITLPGWQALDWSRGHGTVVLPTFGAESRHDLGAALEELGLGPAFVPGGDLEDLFRGDGAKALGRILQRARVDVDDQGTRAAAVTTVTARAVSAVVGPTFHLTFDRPFTWAVEHAPSGTLLFVGRVRHPRERSA